MKVKDAFKLLHTMDGTPDMSMKEAAKKLQLVSKHLVHIAKLYEHGVSTRDDIVLDQLDDAAMCIIAILSYYRDIDSYSEDKHDKCADCDDPECDGCEYDHDCDSCPYDDDATWVPTEKGRKIIEAMKQAREEEQPQEASNYAKGTRVGIIPRPCVKDTGCTTVKDYLQKINEELDELKEAATWWTCSADFKVEDTVEEIKNDVQGSRDTLDDYICGSRWHIAEEAADVCTAVTSLCEALTIDEHMRNAAQQKVNAHNKERGRW